MSAVSKDYAALAASTSTLLESSMMEGDELYDPTTVPIANEEWSKKGGTSNLCRLCANTSDYFIPIFEGEGLEHELSEKIDKHLPIKVCDSDSLPIHVCYQCASTLIAWHDLLLNCVEAEKKLLQIQQQVEQDDLEESKNIEFDAAPSMDSDNAEDSVEATTPLVTPEEMEKSAPSTSKKNTSIKERPSLKRPLAKKSASSQKKARKTETEISPVGPEDGPAEEETVIGRWLPFEELSQFNLEEVQNLNEGDTVLVIEGGLEDNDAVKIAETKEENKELEKHPTYECNFCGLILTNRNKMKVHLEVHNRDETLSCDESLECDEGFIHKLILEEPVKEGDSNKPFTCHMCTKRFNLRSTALRHVKEVHEHTWGHYCPVCNREFARKGAVDNHMRRHTGEKPYTCKICSKNFMVRSTLTRHLKEVHERLRRHFCKVCGYGFYTRLLLRNHIRTHTDDRPYFCRACGRTFRTRVTLVYHEKLHVRELENHPTKGKRVMECSECKKKVGSLYALKNHMLIHTGEKPCSCKVCGKRFTTASDVTRHMKTHIEGKPFLCTKCGSCFKQKRNLRYHDLMQHYNHTD